jgi:hypothetical protein
MTILPVSALPNWPGVFSGYGGKASLIMLRKAIKTAPPVGDIIVFSRRGFSGRRKNTDIDC